MQPSNVQQRHVSLPRLGIDAVIAGRVIATGIAVFFLAILIEGTAFAFLRWNILVPFIESFAGEICHHKPDRSFFLHDFQFPICARCTGLYTGCLAGICAGMAYISFFKLEPKHIAQLLGWSGSFMILGLIEGVLESLQLLDLGNLTRYVFGMFLGFGPMAFGCIGAYILLVNAAFSANVSDTNPGPSVSQD